jgi:hypothetical protein
MICHEAFIIGSLARERAVHLIAKCTTGGRIPLQHPWHKKDETKYEEDRDRDRSKNPTTAALLRLLNERARAAHPHFE